MSAPTCEPSQRDPAEVAPASTYLRGDPVWVHRHGAWRPGVIEGASTRAVTATYRSGPGRGTAVDTMLASDVRFRGDADAQLDSVAYPPGVAA
jgi:hypothetical protein